MGLITNDSSILGSSEERKNQESQQHNKKQAPMKILYCKNGDKLFDEAHGRDN
jgi:hypothetical protein